MLTLIQKQKLSQIYHSNGWNSQYKTLEEFLTSCEEDAIKYNHSKEKIDKLIEESFC